MIQVAKHIESRSVFAHIVPRKGLSQEHGATRMCKGTEYLGYTAIVLKPDNEPAMITLQEEIRSRSRDRTI